MKHLVMSQVISDSAGPVVIDADNLSDLENLNCKAESSGCISLVFGAFRMNRLNCSFANQSCLFKNVAL